MTFKEWFNSAPHRAKYTDDHPAYLAAKEAWYAAHEACAKVCEPKIPRPCDCDFCDCGNSGDRAAVADWDASHAFAAAIRAREEE